MAAQAKQEKVKVGVSIGDVNGIGMEVIIKTFMDKRMLDFCTPVIFGSSKIASYHRKVLNIKDFSFNTIDAIDKASPKRANLLNCLPEETIVELGKDTKASGSLAFESIKQAVEALKRKEVDVLVTAPINKHSIHSSKFNFPGHTEYFAEKFDATPLMLLASTDLKVALVTEHIPISKVAATLSEELILKKLHILNKTLQEDFLIRKPKIAVLSLNPHSGDRGIIGEEDDALIAPTIKKAFDDGMLAYGPYAADGFFGSEMYKDFDATLAMYHDQGLIPFKTLSFHEGVNFTAGLPIIRTSPDHGTAYEIAGKNQASEMAFRNAVFMACKIHRNRLLNNDLTKNPLPSAAKEDIKG